MKKITNKYFDQLCKVIERSLTDSSKMKSCLVNMIDASEDDAGSDHVYKDYDHNMEAIKLDEYTKDFEIRRRLEHPKITEHQPSAVDAVCVDRNNEWYLIEFKNEPLDSALKSTSKKMLSSIWLIAYLYSNLSESFFDNNDLLKFAREKITFITVVSSKKNDKYEEAIGASWDRNGPFYTPKKYEKYKGYYFKDVYVLTESGLRFFIEQFDELSAC